MRSIMKLCKAVLLFLLNLGSLCAGLIIALCPGKGRRLRAGAACMRIWARCACSVLGIRIRKSGPDRLPRGSLIVANHCSYLDILVLGSLVPCVFVAKAEVRTWFFIGRLVQLAGTIFVDRTSRMSAALTMKEIEDCLSSGTSVIIFPEGTTSNGKDILAFKSTFFNAAVERNCSIVPLSLVYSHIDERPVCNGLTDRIAWYGDMRLLPHFWNVLGMKTIEVRVHVNPVIQNIMALDSTQVRKLVSAVAFESVRAGYETLRDEITGTP